jgi:hypothetical protein
VISGQVREFEHTAQSQVRFIQALIASEPDVTVHVLFNVWDKTFSIYPKQYNSFIEQITTDKIEHIMKNNGFNMNQTTINVIPFLDAKHYIDTVIKSPGIDDFSYVSYLNFQSLLSQFKIEDKLGIKFDTVIKIRPDLYLNNFDNIIILNAHDKAAYVHGQHDSFKLTDHITVDSQYNDVYEIFGRTAFIAYCQSLLSLRANAIPVTPFFHSYIVGHLNAYGIKILPLPYDYTPGEFIILRPTHRLEFDINEFIDTPYALVQQLTLLEQHWQETVDKKEVEQEMLAKFTVNNIEYEKRPYPPRNF